MGKSRGGITIKNFDEMGEVVDRHINDTVDRLQRVFGRSGLKEVLKIYKFAGKPMVEDIEIFMKQHKQTGATWKAFNEGMLQISENDYVMFKLGFNLKKDGLPALFLEYGDNGSPMRMPNKAHHFIYYAVENNEDYFRENMIEEIARLVEELKAKGESKE